MTGRCTLNNKSIRNIRRDQVYQSVIIDLTLLGYITKDECEMLIGCGLPKGITLPNGSMYTEEQDSVLDEDTEEQDSVLDEDTEEQDSVLDEDTEDNLAE